MSRVTLAPLSFFFPAVAMEFERAVDGAGSLYIGPQVSLGALRQPGAYAFDFHVGARLFPGGEAPRGFWIGPEVRASSANVSSTSLWGLALLGTIGYSVVTDGGFTVSFGTALGGGVMSSATSPMLAIGMHANIGYAY